VQVIYGLFSRFFSSANSPKAIATALTNPKVPTGLSGITNKFPSLVVPPLVLGCVEVSVFGDMPSPTSCGGVSLSWGIW